jgi:hypothetical protein
MRIANSVERGNTMFKISVVDSRTVRRLVLEGTFITPWVAELRATWAAANVDLQDRKLVLDLKNATLVGGYFLIPFGTYNERLTPLWISNLQDAPLIYSLGNVGSGSGTGGEIRGSAVSNEN